MSLILWLWFYDLRKERLSRKVKTIFDDVEKGKVELMVPAMVLAEIGYLSERNRIETNLNEVKNYCQKYPTVQIDPVTEETIHKSFEIDDIPELHDPIIAGTAHLRNSELVTNDPMIIDSQFVSTVW